jgi:hypothetical protein
MPFSKDAISERIEEFCKENVPSDLYEDCVASGKERTEDSPADQEKTKN